MTIELGKILTDFVEIVEDWRSNLIPNEEEFFDRLKKVNIELLKELSKQKLPEIKVK